MILLASTSLTVKKLSFLYGNTYKWKLASNPRKHPIYSEMEQYTEHFSIWKLT